MAGPGSERAEAPRESALLRFLYRTVPGRVLLRPLTGRTVSRLAGAFLRSRLSRPLIAPFVRKNGVDLSGCERRSFDSFNDFFTRRLRPELRPVDRDPAALIAPCDGLLSAYRLDGDTVLPVKQSCYTLSSLLRDEALARRYAQGTCLVFRLCADHYHHYCYLDDGRKGENFFLPGRLHTVRPLALERLPVFTENCREYTVLETERFGPVVQVEVGALLVGRICNLHGPARFARGEEKGFFAYGGSTILLLFAPETAQLPEALFTATAERRETPVRLGERIGTAVKQEQKTRETVC